MSWKSLIGFYSLLAILSTYFLASIVGAVTLPSSTNSTLKPWSISSLKPPTEIDTSTATLSSTSALAGSLGTSAQIAIGVAVLGVVIALVLSGGWYLASRQRRRPRTDVNIKRGMALTALQPCVQQKAESRVNEMYELEAEIKRSVLNTWGGKHATSDCREIFELPAAAHASGSFVAKRELQSGVFH
ncbi:hypothetical protein N7G274_010697 [Stereocaulon virgatum]|uniref:Uncharacterized protein n=1 Tax=Stereocaulon virgatum TaxID=373712 RepID=A0ABR3ZV60_9LECA